MAECPTLMMLKSFLAGALDDRVEEEVVTHVEECLSCQGTLDDLVGRSAAKPRQAEPEDVATFDPDPTFLKRLQETLADVKSYRLLQMEMSQDPSEFTGMNVGATRPRAATGLIPGYEIERELGRGAMGVVYKAWHHSLARTTALKMILSGEHASVAARTRFRSEAEAAASLRHPNIVQVYEIGETDGLMYYSMEYIEGETLKQSLHGSPQPPRAAALLLRALVRAVAFAHRHGIVHRDLKPANVLLETIDRPESDGRAQRAPLFDLSEGLTELGLVPKIVDFGLAKRLHESLGTQTGQLMGTPSYMSPEQLAGGSGATGPGADIYALGCILYEALTGRPPFVDASLEVLADRVRREEPVPLGRLRPGCPRDLETICLKCLEKEPARRYASAAELADDLGRYLAGEPIKARAPSTLDRCMKFARRNRTLVGGVAGVVIALALGTAATSVMALREAGARRRADLNAQRADAARMDARRGAYQARLTAAMAAMGIHDIREASRQLDQAPEELRGWEWRHLQGRLDLSLAVVAGRSGKTSIAFCPPGGRLAVADGRSDYRLLDAVTGESLDVRGTDAPDSPCRQVFAFSTSAGPRFVVDQSAKGMSLYLADGSGAALGRIGLADPSIESLPRPCAMAMRPDGRRLALQILPYSPRPLVEVFDTSTGLLTARLGADQSRLRALDFSPDGKQIAAVDEDSRVHIFDLHGKSPQINLPGHSADLRGVAYSRDGKRMASCGEDQTDPRVGHADMENTPHAPRPQGRCPVRRVQPGRRSTGHRGKRQHRPALGLRRRGGCARPAWPCRRSKSRGPQRGRPHHRLYCRGWHGPALGRHGTGRCLRTPRTFQLCLSGGL